jgi:hypothetical protein
MGDTQQNPPLRYLQVKKRIISTASIILNDKQDPFHCSKYFKKISGHCPSDWLEFAGKCYKVRSRNFPNFNTVTAFSSLSEFETAMIWM